MLVHQSNMSFTDSLTPGRSTPGFSPGPGAHSRGTTTPAPQPVPAPEPGLVPQLEAPGGKPRSTASGDEADNSFIAAGVPDGTHVLYADPKQHGVRERLMHLFEVSGGPAGESWDVDMAAGGAGMSMDVEEMTLQQLPDIAPAAAGGSGRKSAGKGRRGRKGARS